MLFFLRGGVVDAVCRSLAKAFSARCPGKEVDAFCSYPSLRGPLYRFPSTSGKTVSSINAVRNCNFCQTPTRDSHCRNNWRSVSRIDPSNTCAPRGPVQCGNSEWTLLTKATSEESSQAKRLNLSRKINCKKGRVASILANLKVLFPVQFGLTAHRNCAPK